MTITVGQLISGAMRKARIIGPGEPVDGSEADEARVLFSQMVDGWTNEDLLIPTVNVITHPLVEQPEYTIGIYPEPVPVPLPDTHIETARPQSIQRAFIRDQAGTDFYLKTIDSKYYGEISVKSSVARPSSFYLRKGWPLNTILFDTVPFGGETLHLEVLQPLSEVLPTSDLSDIVNLPPGYERALILNLAIELAVEWGKQPDRTTAALAVQAKRLLKRSNSRKSVLSVDKAITRRGTSKRGTYDINSGPS